MIPGTPLSLLAAGALLAGGPFEVAPRELAWESLDAGVFDRRWTLPEARREGRDLLAEMRDLVAVRFDLNTSGEVAPAALGDLVLELRDLGPAERDRWMAALAFRAPGFFGDWKDGLVQLFRDDWLHSDDWDPAEDHPRDGMLLAADWSLEGYGPPWDGVDAEPVLAQVATLLLADLECVKAVENDYRTYLAHVGADFEEIGPVPDTYRLGADPGGDPFSTLEIRFRSDLPFPFADYTCRLRILNRLGSDGLPRTDIYSTSPDFHFFAGRDVFLPVRTADGELVAHLLVRHLGFDLVGVPDGPVHRREALRSGLGNLKRKAERAHRGDAGFRSTPEELTRFRVVGDAGGAR